METSNTLGALFKSLAEVKSEFKSLSKSKKAFSYKYAPLDSVVEMLNETLPKHGLGFYQFPSNDNEGNAFLTTCVFHESGEWIKETASIPEFTLKGANAMQSYGAAVTYMRRYMLSSAFGIATEEDDDASSFKSNSSGYRQQSAQQNSNTNHSYDQNRSSYNGYKTNQTISAPIQDQKHDADKDADLRELEDLLATKIDGVKVASDATEKWVQEQLKGGHSAGELIPRVKAGIQKQRDKMAQEKVIDKSDGSAPVMSSDDEV